MHLVHRSQMATLLVGLAWMSAPIPAFAQRSSYDFDRFSAGRDTAASRFDTFSRDQMRRGVDRFDRGGPVRADRASATLNVMAPIGSLDLDPYRAAAKAAREGSSGILGDRIAEISSTVINCAAEAKSASTGPCLVEAAICVGGLATKNPKAQEKCLDALKDCGVTAAGNFAGCLFGN